MIFGTIVERLNGRYRIRPDPGEGPDVYAPGTEIVVIPVGAKVEFVYSGLPTLPGESPIVTILRAWVPLWIPLNV